MYSVVGKGGRLASMRVTGCRLQVASYRGFSFFVFRFLFSVFSLLFLSACASVDPVVKIGLVGPFEGEHRAVGYDVIYSARLAVREINAAGGIGGYRIGLVALDDGGNPDLAQQTAASLALDPAVVAVVGHWLPQTTAAAAPVYAEAGLPLLPAGAPPLETFPPAQLPADFRQAYEAVTPFDEGPGLHAAPAYDAFQLLWQALAAAETEGAMTRMAVADALNGLEYSGLSGVVYQAEGAP